ncbi:MAG: hypothetical protein FJ109_14670 [Deltaproteobacteria bacterium]|nr:hypothetical protein [Deltaproteobacteria bacterium]
MSKLLDTVLLQALPASGKSEVRKYMDGLTADQCRDDFHMGPTVQLDDYPYVHLMHRIDDELKKRGQPYVFFKGPNRSFIDNFEWGTLIHMLNDDYADLMSGKVVAAPSAGQWMLDRLDDAHAKVELPRALGDVPYRVRCEVAAAIEKECRKELDYRNRICSEGTEGKTVFIEAARGGPHGATFPLKPPHGYAYSFSQFSSQILSRSCILYIWVTPEESRRKNIERARPDGQGSILHHSVPMEVMLGEYGCDDMEYLSSISEKPDTVCIERPELATNEAGESVYKLARFFLPLARFDNRGDLTSFIRQRKDRKDWLPAEVGAIHSELKRALDKLAAA